VGALGDPPPASMAATPQATPSAICSIGPRALTRPARRARIVSPGLHVAF
jgi:hypothetical protein